MNELISPPILDSAKERHWPAFLALGFAQARDRTRMKQMKFEGPLRVQRPFYPEDDVCHVYLLHPPGGLVSGDDLHIQLESQPGSHALITTPSAGKIYKADSKQVEQKQRVDINVDAAALEWLPMETIVFDGAKGFLNTQVNLYGNAKFIGMDVFCLGRLDSGLPFEKGLIEQRFDLYHNDTPLLLERQRLSTEDPMLSALPAFNGKLISGTLVAFGAADIEAEVAQLRELLAEYEEIRCISVTHRLGLILVRYLGTSTEQAQELLRLCWKELRPGVMGKEACAPRIWAT